MLIAWIGFISVYVSERIFLFLIAVQKFRCLEKRAFATLQTNGINNNKTKTDKKNKKEKM
jgi:hypothetical protein